MSLYIIIPLVLMIGVVIFRKWYNSSTQKGIRGETRVHNVLARLPEDYHLLEDIVLTTQRGTTQIDHVVVSRFGVFVIETKNYRGDIYGNDYRKEWTQIIPTHVTFGNSKTYTNITKNRFYNPVKQSLLHLYEIKNNFNEYPNLKVIPIVVFVGNANLSHVESNRHVVCESELITTIRNYQLNVLSKEDVDFIVRRLSRRNVRKEVSNRQHVQNIKMAKKEHARKVKAGLCPKCRGQLVQRTGSYGSF